MENNTDVHYRKELKYATKGKKYCRNYLYYWSNYWV